MDAGESPSLTESVKTSKRSLEHLLAEARKRRQSAGQLSQETAFRTPAGAERPAGIGGSAGPSGRDGSGGAAAHPAHRSHVRVASFYSASAKRLQQVEDRVLRFLANVRQRLDIGSGGGGASGRDPWHLVPTQQAAFDFADARDPGGRRLRIFSVESGPQGRRRFLATSYAELWRRYRDLPPPHRHHYEIIRQGYPCHLYLDLEFDAAANPGRDGQAAVDAVLSLLREALAARLRLALRDEWVLELDSTTEAKFSRHVVVRLPGAAFASNAHVGAVVREMCAAAAARKGDDPRCAALWVAGRGGSGEACVVDTGVYTRNRAFRLHLSSKAGKEAVLLPTGRFAAASLTTQQVFFQALICNVEPGCELLRCCEEAEEGGARAGAKTAAAAAEARGRRGGAGAQGAGEARAGPSPLPAIDAFIESVAVEGGVQGHVRSWASLDGGALLLLNLRDNRYCGNVGRAHRSNGVFYVVDVQHGAWYQKCYDPDCRQYRSPAAPLPPHLCGLWQPPAGEGGGGEAAAGGDGPLEAAAECVGAWDEESEGLDDGELAAVEAAERRYSAARQRLPADPGPGPPTAGAGGVP